jgi:hypothetical protein
VQADDDGGYISSIGFFFFFIFFSLKSLKTYLRNTMGQFPLNEMALMNIHRDNTLSTEQIIDEFSLKTRRMNFGLDCIFFLYIIRKNKD